MTIEKDYEALYREAIVEALNAYDEAKAKANEAFSALVKARKAYGKAITKANKTRAKAFNKKVRDGYYKET